MNTNSDLMNKVVSSADRITANIALYQKGGKTARYQQCFDVEVEDGDYLVSGYDWHRNGTNPVLSFAREEGISRMALDLVLFCPEVIASFIDYLDEAFVEVVAMPTEPTTELEVISDLKSFPNGDLGEIFVATIRRGHRRELLIAQEHGDEMILNALHIQHLAQGLKNAYLAYELHPYC